MKMKENGEIMKIRKRHRKCRSSIEEIIESEGGGENGYQRKRRKLMAASAAACSEKSAWHGRNAAWENNEAGGEMKAGDGGAWRRGKIEKRNLSKKKMSKSIAAIENEMAMSKISSAGEA
jgi:hypothetical protein